MDKSFLRAKERKHLLFSNLEINIDKEYDFTIQNLLDPEERQVNDNTCYFVFKCICHTDIEAKGIRSGDKVFLHLPYKSLKLSYPGLPEKYIKSKSLYVRVLISRETKKSMVFKRFDVSSYEEEENEENIFI